MIETAPALDLPETTRENMFRDSVNLLGAIKYKNAGTVEFLVDEFGRHYFMEVNPRVQVRIFVKFVLHCDFSFQLIFASLG